VDATFLARRDDEPVAGICVTIEQKAVGPIAVVVDVEPLTGGDEWRAGLAAAIDRLREAYPGITWVKSWDPVPSSVLRPLGFLPADRPPLSYGTPSAETVLHLVGRPLDRDGPETIESEIAQGTRYLWTLADA
jgi:hypothetical protein